MTTTTNTVAQTIASQIGQRAFFMLGAHGLVGSEDSLHFAIRGSKKCNKIVVKYDVGSDTYTIESWKVGRIKFAQVASFEGVYVDAMHRTIETLTGLYTSL